MRITEFMYSGTPGAFFELTNVGDTPLSLAGWSIDDNTRQAGSVSLSGLGTVLPGESVVITEASATAFRTAWKLGNFVKVLGGNTQNLDRSDEINLYDATGNLVDRLTFNDQSAPATIRTQAVSGWTTLAKLGTNTMSNWRLSALPDRQNSYTASSGNIGTPGTYKYGGEEAVFIEVDGSATTWQLRMSGSSPAFITGAVGDPTDPASVSGIAFALDDPRPPFNNVTVTASSSNPAVVPNSNLVFTGGGTWYNLKITPTGVGYTTITVLAKRGPETDTYLINYAASAAAATTRYHTGTGDGSTAIGIDANYMLVPDDENQAIHLFHRTKSGYPFRSFDFSSVLNLTDGKEVDIEGSLRTGNRIFWIGSQSNNDNGEAQPSRNRVFATTVNSTGNTTYLGYLGRYDYLREDLIAWDTNNRHGKGANYYGFAASAAPGVNPKQAAGYSIEGLELAPDNTTAYMCFRGPLVPATNRTKALVVPVTNFTTLFGDQAPGTATFGAPIELDLGGRGIREMRKNPTNTYVIVAGPPGEATGVAPADFRLYTWDGNPNTAPVLRPVDLSSLNMPGNVEGIVEVPILLTNTTPIQFLTDNNNTAFYGDGTPTKDLSIVQFKKFRSEWITLSGQTEPLTLLTPLFDCQTRSLTFRTSGGDGSPIEFSAIGVTNWTINPNQTIEAGVLADQNSGPLTLRARQNNQVIAYTFDLHAACGGAGTPLELLSPSFDCQTGAINFRTNGGNGSPIEFFAVGVTGWTTNPNQTVEVGVLADKNTSSLLLMARQNGRVVSYPFEFRDQCPVSLTAYLGQQVSQTPGWVLLDRESDVLMEATGLPPGIRLDLVQIELPDSGGLYWVFSGAPASNIGSPYRVVVTRRYKFAPSKFTQTVYLITVLPSPLMFLPPAYDCATGALIIRYGYGDFTSVEKMVPGLADWQNSSTFTVPLWIRTNPNAQPLQLMLRQNGQVFTYVFNFRAQCSTGRLAASETDTDLHINVLGNPVSGEIVAEVSGATGQPLCIRLTQIDGRVLAEQQVDSAQATERIRIPLSGRPAGMLLLNAATPTRHQTVRVLTN